MIKQVTSEDVDDIIDFMKYNFDNLSPFIYCNLRFYEGCNEPNYHFYFEKNQNKYNCFISIYDNTAQIWVGRNPNFNDIRTFLTQNKVNAIFGTESLFDGLNIHTNVDCGYILKFDHFTPMDNELPPCYTLSKKINDSNYLEIAQLVFEDSPLKSVTTINDMASRFKERSNSGYGRNIIVLYEDAVVGHIATYAETDDVAVIGGVATSNKHRKKGIATFMIDQMVSNLVKENKSVYLFCFDDEIIKMYEKHGFVKEIKWLRTVINNI